MSSKSTPSSDDDRDSAGAWSQKLATSSLMLADTVNAEDLAEEFGDIDDDRRDELCNEAAMQAIDDGANEITMAHFRAANEKLVGDSGEDSDTKDDETGAADSPESATVTEDSLDEEDGEVSDTSSADPVSEESDSASPTDGPEADQEETETDPAEMARSELESEVEDLRAEVDKIQEVANRDVAIIKGALTNLLGVKDIEELPAAGQSLRDRLDDQDESIADVEDQVEALDGVIADGGGGKSSKIRDIVQMADNRRSDEGRVLMTVPDIIDATGVSRRYAYDLIEDLPDDREWILAREEMKQYGDLQIDKDEQTKAIGIDFEGVHGRPCPVNKFTTGGE